MTKINTHAMRGVAPAERFAAKVHTGPGDCHTWASAIGSRGYGIFWVSAARRSVMAHRYAWELAHGEVPPADLLVMHSCDNPACVNPAHLSLGTNSDNQLDASRKGRNAKGERNGGGVKLTEAMVRAIKSSAGSVGCRLAAQQFNVSTQTIKAIRRGRLWRHVEAT